MSVIFAFLAMVFWGVGDFLIQKTIKKIGDLETVLVISVCAAVFLLPFIYQDLGLIFSLANLPALLAISVIETIYNILLFRSYSQGKLSVIEMVSMGELPLTIIFGLVFFHESLDLIKLVIILLVVTGAIFISKYRASRWDRIKSFFNGQKRFLEKGVLLAIAAITFSALYYCFVTLVARDISAYTAIWVPWTFNSIVIFIYLLYKNRFGNLLKKSRDCKRLMMSTALIDVLAWVCYALAVAKKELAIITTIVSGYAVIAFILGVKMNKEKITSWQYGGAVLIIIGVFLMALVGY